MSENIYITDLDGTLLDNNAELAEDSQKTINDLIEGGTLFTVASARSHRTIKSIIPNIKFKLPIIEFNGGYITDFESGRHLVVNNIESEETASIYSVIKENEFEPLVSAFDGETDELFYFKSTSVGMDEYIDDREKNGFSLRRFNNFSEINNQKIMCFTVIDEKDRIINLQKVLNKTFHKTIIVEAWEDMYYKPWYWLSVHSIESTKANAIMKLCEMENINYDRLITFGDNLNDIEMFKISYKSYAVENAVEELKNLAYEVIGTNIEDSVVRKIINLEENNDGAI